MSLDIHPNHGNLFAVGFYDGENIFMVDSLLMNENNTLLKSNRSFFRLKLSTLALNFFS